MGLIQFYTPYGSLKVDAYKQQADRADYAYRHFKLDHWSAGGMGLPVGVGVAFVAIALVGHYLPLLTPLNQYLIAGGSGTFIALTMMLSSALDYCRRVRKHHIALQDASVERFLEALEDDPNLLPVFFPPQKVMAFLQRNPQLHKECIDKTLQIDDPITLECYPDLKEPQFRNALSLYVERPDAIKRLQSYMTSLGEKNFIILLKAMDARLYGEKHLTLSLEHKKRLFAPLSLCLENFVIFLPQAQLSNEFLKDFVASIEEIDINTSDGKKSAIEYLLGLTEKDPASGTLQNANQLNLSNPDTNYRSATSSSSSSQDASAVCDDNDTEVTDFESAPTSSAGDNNNYQYDVSEFFDESSEDDSHI